jgi:nucleotide-binding universal stress UspA family protein
MGSVTEEVLRGSSVPIFLVPPSSEERTPSLRRILIPFDGSERAAGIVPCVRDLAKLFRAHAFLVTVYPVKDEKENHALSSILADLNRIETELKNDQIDTTRITRFGNPTDEILAVARSKNINVIALATHGRTGWDRLRYGSVAESLLHRARLPMLVVRTGGWQSPTVDTQKAASQKG